MRLNENWAIDPDRIRRFFSEQSDVIETGNGFQFRQCQITLHPCEGTLLGKWPQKRTLLIMDGPEEDTAQIYRRFFLRFLSAGG